MLLFIDGFDYIPFGTSDADLMDWMQMKYSAVPITGLSLVAGRNAAPGILLGSNQIINFESRVDYAGNEISAPATERTHVLGMAVNFQSIPGSTFTLCGMVSAFGDFNCQVRMLNTGELQIVTDTTANNALTGFTPTLNEWYYIEVKCFSDVNPTGFIEMRVDGVVQGSALFGSTARFSARPSMSWQIRGVGTGMRLDDLYWLDGRGTVNNDYLGDCKVKLMRPESDDVTDAGWTRSPASGSFATKVNEEVPFDEDSTYVAADTTAAAEVIFNYSDPQFIDGTIFGAQIETYGRLVDGEWRPFHHVVDSGSTKINLAANDYGSDERWIGIWDIIETDPDTGVLWTDAGLSAAKFGLEVG